MLRRWRWRRGGRIGTRGTSGVGLRADAWPGRSAARHGHVVGAAIRRNDAPRIGPVLHIEEARGGGLFEGALGNSAGESGERAEQDDGPGRRGRAQFPASFLPGEVVKTTTCAPKARANLTAMCPRPPRPTTPTFCPGPTFQWRNGD